MHVGMSFQILDLLVVLTIVVSTVYAVYRGFVNETLAILAWAAAALATLYFGPPVAGLLHGTVSPSWLGDLIGYAGVFLIVVIPLSFLSFRLSQNVKKSQVGPLDRSLGAVFGVLRGLAVLGMLYIVFSAIVPVSMQPNWVTSAYSLSLVQSSAEVIASLVPDHPDDERIDDRGARETRRRDGIGDLIEGTAAPSHHSRDRVTEPTRYEGGVRPIPRPTTANRRHKTYGAKERQALDTLIEDTSDGKSREP